ncbi:hypothetical protein CRG98_007549 [Punica granatum]|uniref:Tf2-1-like SH3-like domain-containing protein n=1 Tax=Punica granatum TaxID=22663 RepID=A0A2I0KUB2_PUNGR|nr:hypothetical protein CRG98_007549 [Punica granatum]
MAEWWYNTIYHTTIKLIPFEALYRFPPLLHMPYFPRDSSVASVDSYLKDMELMIHLLKHHLHMAQNIMKFQADEKRSETSFSIGDWLYLKLQRYKQESMGNRSCQKFSPRYYGPFKILDKIGEVAYKLELPSSAEIHHTFHVSQLKKAVASATTMMRFSHFNLKDKKERLVPGRTWGQRLSVIPSKWPLIKQSLFTIAGRFDPSTLVNNISPLEETLCDSNARSCCYTFLGEENKDNTKIKERRSDKGRGTRSLADSHPFLSDFACGLCWCRRPRRGTNGRRLPQRSLATSKGQEWLPMRHLLPRLEGL